MEFHVQRAATDVMQSIIFAAVADAIEAVRKGSGGVPNVMLRDLQSLHPNTAFADLPKAVQESIAQSVRAAFTQLLKEGYAVGPKGTVYAFQPAEFISYKAQYGEDLKTVTAALPNSKAISGPWTALDLPDNVDLVITVQNYHDMHLKPFPVDTAAKANAEIFKSLKPGGVFLVVDHAALPGATTAPDTLHRIDVAQVTLVRR